MTIPGAAGATRAGRRRRPALPAAAALLLVAVLGGAAWAFRARPGAADAQSSGTRALAVLPFEHQGDSSEVYLTEGITDEIRGTLAGVRDLVVIARASSNQYRGTTKTPRQIAEELGVRYLLTATVRVSGTGAEQRVIVRPELVEVTAAGQPQSRWGRPFDVRGTDALQLQGAIALQVVGAMEVAVGGTDQARLVAVPTRDPAAYDAYLCARAETRWGDDGSPAAQHRAIPLYEEAVRRDSTMVDAWAALATARALLYVNGRERTPALAEAARAAAERTLALDPGGARPPCAGGVPPAGGGRPRPRAPINKRRRARRRATTARRPASASCSCSASGVPPRRSRTSSGRPHSTRGARYRGWFGRKPS